MKSADGDTTQNFPIGARHSLLFLIEKKYKFSKRKLKASNLTLQDRGRKLKEHDIKCSQKPQI